MKKPLFTILLLTFAITAFSQNREFVITYPPAELGLDKFYKKYTDASGITIVSSWRVPDDTMVKVAQMTEFFLNKQLR